MNIWAHRGLSRLYPENTLTAFEKALEYDITGIELDVQMTRDGELVVIHDEKVDRTTDGVGAVKDFSFEEIRKLKIKCPEGHERIPTLEEVIKLVSPYFSHGVMINIELKNSVERYPGMEEKVAKLVREMNAEDNVIYSSFSFESVNLMKKISPGCEAGYLGFELDRLIEEADSNDNPVIHPYVWSVNRPLCGMRVRAFNLRGDEYLYPVKGADRKLDTGSLEKLGITDYITNNPDYYVSLRRKTPSLDTSMEAGRVDSDNGFVVYDEAFRTNFEPVRVDAGMKLHHREGAPEYKSAFYSADAEDRLVHEYYYSPDMNWGTYERDLSVNEWSSEDLEIKRDGFIRITAKDISASVLSDIFETDDCLRVNELPEYVIKGTQKLKKMIPKDAVNYILLADTHYAKGSGFEKSAQNMKHLAERIPVRGVIHLGDYTDGITLRFLHERYVRRVISLLENVSHNLILLVGNHDLNYFRNNPDAMTSADAAVLVTGRKNGRFTLDDEAAGIRFIGIDSFDYRKKQRYGFMMKDALYLTRALKNTPEGMKAVILTHVPPDAEIHPWSKSIRNGRWLMRSVSRIASQRGLKCIWITGHNHAELTDASRNFDLISIASNKTEEFMYRKLDCFEVLKRNIGDDTEDLFYILSVNDGKVQIYRFGAGRTGRFYREETD